MIVKVTPHFNKDLSKLSDKKLIQSIKTILQKLEMANSLTEIPALKKMEGATKHFRIRIGNFRMGIYFDDNTVYIARFLHRKEIYRYFP